MQIEKIPQCLTSLPQWVVWKEVEREDGETTKVPFQISGCKAKSNDPMTWSTFAEAVERFQKGGYNGIGFMFSENDEFAGIDLDGCRDPETKKFAPWAIEILRQLDSYSEVSPSGTGVKVFVRGASRLGGGKKTAVEAEPVSGKAPAIEFYDRLRYFAVTGRRMSGVSPNVEQRQEALDALSERFWPKRPAPAAPEPAFGTVIERARKYVEKLPAAVSGNGGHNRTFHAACVLVLGFGLGRDDAFALLSEFNQRCEPPWSERELWHKIDSAEKQPGDRNYLRDAKPSEWIRIPIPRYEEPKPLPEVASVTLESAANKYLDAVCGGISTFVELGLPDLDYAIGGGAERGEMIILAGRPGHGKSAIALQSIHHATSRGMPSLMISEEMSSLAIGKRVLQFASDVPQEHWYHDQSIVREQIYEHFRARAACIIVENCRTAERAADEIRKAVKEHGVQFAAVDYAQMLQSRGNGRYEQITNTSIALRQVTSECKIVLIVLCQLNRAIESRTSFVPYMSDLKDSGQLEQDADVIIFQVWPHRIDSKRDPHEYQFFVAKNRNRPINQPALSCRFLASRQMFVDERAPAEPHWEDAPAADRSLF